MKKLEKAYLDCLNRLYLASDKPTKWEDVDQSVDDFFSNYEVEEELYHKIVADVKKEYKIKSKGEIIIFDFNIHLGPSPKIKKDVR